MWSSKKQKNRRFQRKHVLDVKLRAKERHQVRVRRFAITSIFLITIVAAFFSIWRGGEWLLRHLLFENQAFSIHQLEVQTDGAIALEQLRRWAGVKFEDNLLALDLARIKRDLELIPVIHSATIERVLPHTLRIRIGEREPIAQFPSAQLRPGIQPDKGPCLLDAEGYVMWPLQSQHRSIPAQTNDHLPVLTGIRPADVVSGRRVESPQIQAALQFLQAFDRSPMASLVDLKEIDLSYPNILQVTTAQGSQVVFGVSELDGQLRRWRSVHNHGEKIGKFLAWMDLSVGNNVPARWLEANLTPLPKMIKPLRTKKKNV